MKTSPALQIQTRTRSPRPGPGAAAAGGGCYGAERRGPGQLLCARAESRVSPGSCQICNPPGRREAEIKRFPQVWVQRGGAHGACLEEASLCDWHGGSRGRVVPVLKLDT